jgi:hypothetical protein
MLIAMPANLNAARQFCRPLETNKSKNDAVAIENNSVFVMCYNLVIFAVIGCQNNVF